MQDQPTAVEILGAVSKYLRDTLSCVTDPQVRFQLRVSASALDIVKRELLLHADEDEQRRLEHLTGHTGTLAELNTDLCALIRDRSIPANSHDLLDHLWRTTLAKVAIDQPSYRAYQRVVGQEHTDGDA